MGAEILLIIYLTKHTRRGKYTCDYITPNHGSLKMNNYSISVSLLETIFLGKTFRSDSNIERCIYSHLIN